MQLVPLVVSSVPWFTAASPHDLGCLPYKEVSSHTYPPYSATGLFPMIPSGRPVFHFRSRAVYIAACTFEPLANVLKAAAIVLKVIFYITSKCQVEPKLLKYYQLRVLASNRKWDSRLVLLAACIVEPGIRWIGKEPA